MADPIAAQTSDRIVSTLTSLKPIPEQRNRIWIFEKINDENNHLLANLIRIWQLADLVTVTNWLQSQSARRGKRNLDISESNENVRLYTIKKHKILLSYLVDWCLQIWLKAKLTNLYLVIPCLGPVCSDYICRAERPAFLAPFIVD